MRLGEISFTSCSLLPDEAMAVVGKKPSRPLPTTQNVGLSETHLEPSRKVRPTLRSYGSPEKKVVNYLLSATRDAD
jgi:hypothetical protein